MAEDAARELPTSHSTTRSSSSASTQSAVVGSTKRAALRWLERYLAEGPPGLREVAVMAANLAELE